MRLWESRAFEPHQEVGRLVVVEGDPGAGKTSAIASACRSTDVFGVPQLDHVAGTLQLVPFDPSYPEDWYVAAERARQAQIQQLLRLGHRVLQDRGVLSTLAFVYATTFGSHESGRVRRLLRRLTEGQGLIRPDLLVILSVDVRVGLQRRAMFRDSEQYRVWFDPEFLARYQEFYRVLAPRALTCPTVVIDTSSLSYNSVCRELVRSYSNWTAAIS